MNINGKWYSEPELAAYIKELEEKLHDRDLEADNGARQIAHYEDELRQAKELLKVAVHDIQDMLFHVNGITACLHCVHENDICYGGSDCEHEAKWEHLSEALALIGEDGEQIG